MFRSDGDSDQMALRNRKNQATWGLRDTVTRGKFYLREGVFLPSPRQSQPLT